MQPARIKPHAKEHTNNPVQKPNFRGHAAGDGEVTLGSILGVLLSYYSWNGGRAEAVCAGEKGVRMR